MENEDIRQLITDHQIEWETLARAVDVPFRDFVRRMNSKRLSPALRQAILKAINRIAARDDCGY